MQRASGGSAEKAPALLEDVLTFGPFEFDPGPRLLYRGAREILLPPRAAALLEVFLRRPGEVISKDDLLDAVWKDAFVGEDSLTQALSIIRQALGDDAREPLYIETKRKRGYRFIVRVGRRSHVDSDSPGADVTGPDAGASGGAPPQGFATDFATRIHGALAVGTQLGHYEILGNLGAGAMGVVYRARDNVLDREVAIKMLPPGFLSDPERIALLERESKLLASVSHPNVAHIHSLEEFEGVRFPVLELVEGQTLDARLSGGRMSVREALELGRQIAAGMEAAHVHGVVHRDLKPANIKVTPGGLAKVLDFGLAASLDVEVFDATESEPPTQSITVGGSYRGAIVGTVAYMSPEQARGQEADRHADIWAFGCVLYEALSGRKAFDRGTVSDTLAAIAEEEPDWSALPADTPRLALSVVRRCLRKDPAQRLRDIADARLEIEEALDEPVGGLEGAAAATSPPALWRRALPWSLAVVAVAVALWSLVPGSPPPPPRVARALIELPPGQHLTGGDALEAGSWGLLRPSRTAVALSPNGEHLVYSAAGDNGQQLHLREMGRQQANPIPGTEGGSNPFFSPDGEWVGFYASGALKKARRDGGDPQTIVANAPPPFGASWADDDTVVFAAGELGALLWVSAGGGMPEPLTTLDLDRGETAHRLPHVLPGSKAVLYTVMYDLDSAHADVVVQSLESDQRRVLFEGGSDARYVSTGHVVFVRDGALMAAPFSPERLEVTAQPVRIVEDLLQASGAAATSLDTGAGQFGFSAAAGTLVYATGGTYPEPRRSLVWVERNGNTETLPLPKGGYSAPRVSPDGERLVYILGRRTDRDLWVYDRRRETTRRLTFDGSSGGPVWSPDGRRLAYPSSGARGPFNIFWTAADGSEEPARLTTSTRPQFASSWSAVAGLAFVEGFADVSVLSPVGEETEPRPFLGTPLIERWPAFSPDGRWIAYSSNETGQDEVFVRPYPGPGPAVRVSPAGGQSPAWSRDGRELYYREGNRMMVVPVSLDGAFAHESASELFESGAYGVAAPTRAYDTAPDGRFLMTTRTEQQPRPVSKLHVVFNWFEELQERVPAQRR